MQRLKQAFFLSLFMLIPLYMTYSYTLEIEEGEEVYYQDLPKSVDLLFGLTDLQTLALDEADSSSTCNSNHFFQGFFTALSFGAYPFSLEKQEIMSENRD